MGQDPYAHWQAGLVSIIIPVLELKRSRRLRYPLAKRRNISDLLGDLEKITGVDLEIIVVCNSRDEELVKLVSTDSRIDKYCLNSVNVGVARSWNMGAMLAEGEFLCYINDDVKLGKRCLERLKDIMQTDCTVGVCGPEGALWPNVEPGDFVGREQIEEADAISGFLFMVQRNAFDEIGGFDVAYTPAGGEEIDFSFALRKAGYKCVVVPGLDVNHHGLLGVSSRNIEIRYLSSSVTTKELETRNRGILKRKWGERSG